MPVEFIGMIGTWSTSELDGSSVSLTGRSIHPDYVHKFAQVYEEGGFDRVLIDDGSTGADALSVAAYAASVTEKLRFLIPHRPGLVAPTVAARQLATLDRVTSGRIAVNMITSSSDSEQQRDGDWLDQDTRYRRTDEYLNIVRQAWTSDTPFDYEGEFYQLKNAFSAVKPLQQPYLPIYVDGASEAAALIGAKHGDVYVMGGEPLAVVKEQVAAVKAAAPPNRFPRFCVSLRPILGETEQKAWERAYSILSRIKEARAAARNRSPRSPYLVSMRPEVVGSRRLLEFAQESAIHDKRLWTPIATATEAYGNTTALIGTPEQVAETLFNYYEAGVTTVLIRGFYPFEDAIAYSRDVIPLVRAEVQRRERVVVAVGN